MNTKYLDHFKSRYSIAVTRIIAATAGCSFEEFPAEDLNKQDCHIWDPSDDSSRIAIQAKATTAKNRTLHTVNQRLDIDTYNRIKDNKNGFPFYLFTVILPENPNEWLNINQERIAVHHAAYYKSLEGEPDKPGQQTVTVHIPTENLLTTESLRQIMTAAITGESI